MKRVLIVDDASFMRMSIKNMLANYDFEIVESWKWSYGYRKIQRITTRYSYNGYNYARDGWVRGIKRN